MPPLFLAISMLELRENSCADLSAQPCSIAAQLIRIEEAKKTKNAQVSIPRSPSSGRSQPSQAQPDKAHRTQTTRDDMMQQNVDNTVRY